MTSLQDKIETLTKQRDCFLEELAVHRVALIDSCILGAGNGLLETPQQIYEETLRYTRQNRQEKVQSQIQSLIKIAQTSNNPSPHRS